MSTGHVIDLAKRVDSVDDTPITRFLAVCSCGWKGQPRGLASYAIDDGDLHETAHQGRWRSPLSVEP